MNEEYRYIKDILTKDEELWERFKYYYTFKKFGNYIFTLNRINIQFKHQYVLDISKEFNEAEKLGELDKSIFPDVQLKKLELLMSDPEMFYLKEGMKDNST